MCTLTTDKETVEHAIGNAIRSGDIRDTKIFMCVLHHYSEALDQNTLNEALLSACNKGKLFIVQKLLSLNADVNCQDSMGNTPLLKCAMNGFCDIARLLLHHGANVKCTNNNGDSPLILSVTTSGSTDMIRLLLNQSSVDIFQKNNQGFSCLTKAIEKIDLDAISIFCYYFKKRGFFSIDKELFKKMIDEAEVFADKELFKKMIDKAEVFADEIGIKLLKYIKNDIISYNNALVAAAMNSDLQSVKMLTHLVFLDYENGHKCYGQALSEILIFYKKTQKGVNEQDVAIIRELVLGFNVFPQRYRCCYNNLLIDAVETENCQVLDLVCQYVNQAVPNNNQKHYEYGLDAAIRLYRFDMIHLLFKYNKHFWSKIDNKLHFVNTVFEKADFDMIKLIYTHEDKGNVEYIQLYLHNSIHFNKEEWFDLALEIFHSQAMTFVHNSNIGLLHNAVASGNRNIVTKLIKLGADVNGKCYGRTPLMLCCENAEMKDILIKNGADSQYDNNHQILQFV